MKEKKEHLLFVQKQKKKKIHNSEISIIWFRDLNKTNQEIFSENKLITRER